MKKWRNQGGALCWGEEYKTSKQVQKLTDEQIKDIVCTGVALTDNWEHVVCWYELRSGDALYIVSDYDAKEVARMADTGETVDIMAAYTSGRTFGVGYIIPGPIVTYGVVTDLAGYVCVPASMVASTIWTGTGYVHDPDR